MDPAVAMEGLSETVTLPNMSNKTEVAGLEPQRVSRQSHQTIHMEKSRRAACEEVAACGLSDEENGDSDDDEEEGESIIDED